MAQVPYNPTPQVAPTQVATPQIHEDTPGAAFGTNIAEAIQGLGAATTGVGNELFGRAVALKQLDNESEARDADTNYMIEVGKLHADFSVLEGKARQDAFDGYMKSIQDLRQKYRGGLSNDMARRMYDANSLSTMGRTIFNGAGQAASGGREYANKTISANLDTLEKQNEDILDPGTLEVNMQKAEDLARKQAALQGAPPGSSLEQKAVLEAQSKMLRGRIRGLASQGKIDAASDLIDKYQAKMTVDDFKVANDYVKTQDRAIGASVISNDVYGSMGVAKPDKPAASLTEMEAEVRTQAEKRRPGDSIFADHAIKAMQSRYYIARNAERQDQLQLTQDVAGFVKDNQPKDLQEFFAKGGQDFYNKMRPSDQLAFPGVIAKYNKQQNQETNWAEYQRLRGMAENPQRTQDFLSEDPSEWKVDHSQWNQLMNARKSIIKSGVSDPHVSKAYSWLQDKYGATMRDLNLIGPNQDKEEHDKLWGRISDAVDAWRDTNKISPSYNDFMDKIAPALMKQIQVPGRFWGTNTVRGYGVPVPDDFKEQFIQDTKKAGGKEPDDEEITHEYNRRIFKGLFQQSGKPAGLSERFGNAR